MGSAGPVAAQETLRLAGPPVQRSGVAATSAPLVLADTTIIYDDGAAAAVTVDGVPRIEAYGGLGSESHQANRFVKPAGGTLVRISVAPYYEDDFEGSGLPDSLARNFRLVIWAHEGGLPGSELFAVDLDDPRANESGGTLNFFEVDTLSFFPDEMAALPDTFYVGLTNTGDDENYLVMGVSAYEGDPVAFLYRPEFYEGQGGWRPFSELSSDETAQTLENRVLPIRAVFERPEATAGEDPSEVPERVALHPNFPNPFNPTTTIRYDLPQATTVRLVVYDVLGREVAVLVDERQVAGGHQVAVDAGRWASGVYVYTIEAAGTRSTRRMVLLK